MSRLKNSSVEVNGAHVCSNMGCGRSFERPLKLTVLCSDPVETYLACPFCMSRVDLEPQQPRTFAGKTTRSDKPALSLEVPDAMSERRLERSEVVKESVGKVECQHEFGYLKNRPKGKPIPDECLTCTKMIQCLM